MKLLNEVIILSVLSYCAYTDIKNRTINMICLYICFAIGIIEGLMLNGKLSLLLIGMLPGIIVVLISLITRSKIGLGDGFIIMAVGALTDIIIATNVILIASIIAGVYSFIMLILKKLNRKDKIPFAPFILTGFLGVLVFG